MLFEHGLTLRKETRIKALGKSWRDKFDIVFENLTLEQQEATGAATILVSSGGLLFRLFKRLSLVVINSVLLHVARYDGIYPG